jgi:3',5'-nucleoside bisphosphate phosphatase
MYFKGDFHIHTSASDGKYSPSDVVTLAKSQGVDILSITDHDTIASLEEAMECGVKNGIKVIPGIELSTLYKGKSVHILGYFKNMDYKNQRFLDYLKEMNDYRIYRAQKIVENLDAYFNIKLDYEDILKSAQGIIARPHIAKAIMEAGYSHDWDYIFQNFISEDSPAYVPNKKLSTKEGVDFLKSMNAITVLAHPVLIKNANINEMLQFGFDGIEAIYYMNTESQTKDFVAFAKKNNLIITAGSDFHGISKADGSHADKIGAVFLNSNEIDTFLKKLQSI